MTALHYTSSAPARLHRLHLRAVEPGRHATLKQVGRQRSARQHVERLRLFAAMRARPPVFAYWSAALVHGLPLLCPPPATVHVAAPDRPTTPITASSRTVAPESGRR